MNATNDPHEDELRAPLHDWGRDAEQRSPAFHDVWHRAKQSLGQHETKPRSSPMVWALAAAAAMVCGAAITWMHPPSPQNSAAEQPIATADAVPTTASTFDPTAPTDFLLTAATDSGTPSVPQLTREINALLTP